jgi:PAS domain-containing protein
MNPALTRALVARAAAAERRLASLEGEGSAEARSAPQLLKVALRELGELLEELRVATEQLQAASDDLAAARREADANAGRFMELYERLPLACVLTDDVGMVDEANTLAATLLNVARPHLSGKPLLLFLPEREHYFQLVQDVRVNGSAAGRVLLRPREKKPRPVGISITALPQQLRWCWVFSDIPLGG